MIADKDESIKTVRPRMDTKSDVWSHGVYRFVFKNGIKLNFVFCVHCKHVITFKSKQGTGSLWRHRCFRERKDKVPVNYDSDEYECNAILTTTPNEPEMHEINDDKQQIKKRKSPQNKASPVPTEMNYTTKLKPKSSKVTSTVDIPPSSYRHIMESYKFELFDLISKEDPSIQLGTPTESGLVWSFGNYKSIYKNEFKQDFVLCTLCNELVLYRKKIGLTNMFHHPCFTVLYETKGANTADTIKCISKITNNGISFKQSLHVDKCRLVFRDGQQIDVVTCTECEEFFDNLIKFQLHACVNRNYNAAATTMSEIQRPHIPETVSVAIKPEIVPQIVDIINHQHHHLHANNFIPSQKIGEFMKMQLNLITDTYISADTLESPEFLKLAQLLVEIGASYGPINIDEAVMCKERFLMEREIELESIKRNIQKILLNNRISYSCEQWTDLNRKKNNIAIRGHFIDESFRMQSCLFDVCTQNSDDSILQVNGIVLNVLEQYTSIKQLKDTIIVSNTNDDLTTFKKVKCSATQINEIVNTLLADDSLKIKKIILAAKEFLNKNPQENYKSIPSISETSYNWKDVWDFFTAIKEIPDIPTLDQFITPDIILDLFKPFRQALIILSSIDEPTINQVCVIRKKLSDHFSQPCSVKNLKKQNKKALDLIQDMFPVSDAHKLAVFLDPRFKSLKFMTEADRNAVINMTKKLVQTNITKICAGDSEQNAVIKLEDDLDINDGENKPEGTPLNDKNLDGDKSLYLMEYMDENINDEEPSNEIDIYINLKLGNSACTDILGFWKSRTDLIGLRSLAKTILGVPACSSAEACCFSIDAIKFSTNRLKIGGDDLKSALLINENKGLQL